MHVADNNSSREWLHKKQKPHQSLSLKISYLANELGCDGLEEFNITFFSFYLVWSFFYLICLLVLVTTWYGDNR